MKCWDNRTELEKTLLLVLCVTIPVNAILAYLYFYFISHYPPHKNLEDNKEIRPRMQMADYPDFEIEPWTYTGSISEKISTEIADEFKCIVVLISENYVLTSDKECLEVTEATQMRISSQYWFKGGTKQKISDIYNGNIYLIIGKLAAPLIIDGISINMVNMTAKDKTQITDFETYRWNRSYTNIENEAMQYNTLQILQLTASKCSTAFSGFCAIEEKNDLNDENIGREPAFETGTNTLLGFEVYRRINDDTIEHFYGIVKNDTVQTVIRNKIKKEKPELVMEPYTFIGSVNDKITSRKNIGFKFKCTVVLLTENFILSSNKCLDDLESVKMRISSEYWFKGGREQKISGTNHTGVEYLTIGILSEPLVIDKLSINTVNLTTKTETQIKEFETYRWNTSYTNNKIDAKRHNKLQKFHLIASDCSVPFDGFCAVEEQNDFNNENINGEPAFEIGTNTLVGFEAYRLETNNKIEHFYSITNNDTIFGIPKRHVETTTPKPDIVLEPYTFIGSVSEKINSENNKGFKFKCTVVLLTEKYVITQDKKCLNNIETSKMRISSEYWFKGGEERKISETKDLYFQVGILSEPLVISEESVNTVNFTNREEVKELDAYRWYATDKNENDAKKYNKLQKIHLNVTDCETGFVGFCATEKKNDLNAETNARDPVFATGTNILVGFEVYRKILDDKITHFYRRASKKRVQEMLKTLD